MPKDADINDFKEKIRLVDHFLDSLCQRNNHIEIKTACLTELHKIIMLTGRLRILLHFCWGQISNSSFLNHPSPRRR